MTDKNKLADELHAFVAAAPHKYPGHLIELFERVEAALRSSAVSAHEALKPLADLYDLIDDRDADPDTDKFFQHDGTIITFGDIRRARNVLRAEPQTASDPDHANLVVLIQRLRSGDAGGLKEEAYQSLCGIAADALSHLVGQRSQAESVQRQDQTPVSYQRRNIGPDGTPFSTWYLTEDEPTPENMKFDGYLSYEYRPLYAGLPLSRLPAESAQKGSK